MSVHNYYYYKKIRFLLIVLLAIGTLSFVGWLVCFFWGICGWKLGVIIIIPTVLIAIWLKYFNQRCGRCDKIVTDDHGSIRSWHSGDNNAKRERNFKDFDNRRVVSAPKKAKTAKKGLSFLDIDENLPKGKTYLPKKPRQNKNNTGNTYSSVFAPAEVRKKTYMLVQVYLHLLEETEKVKALAKESQRNAKRRDYIPLECRLKKGDKVDVLLSIYGETLLTSELKSLVWHGSFTKCSFEYYVPSEIEIGELSCVVSFTINGIPIGEMRFITKIVDAPRKINPEVIAHKYHKVFVSYSHLDESKVKFLHEGLEIAEVTHFFDREYLKAGDVFPKIIQDYINTADLFILCWSENASKSEYVQKERLQALTRAFPQVQPEKDAKLRIYSISIEPRAELPSDMKNNYHFEII